MPLDAARANALTTAINEASAAVGKSPATKMPTSRKNTEAVAWEYHVASHLLRIAEARKKLAHKNAVKVGVIFDHEKDPRPVGTSTKIYAGEVVEISVAVTTASAKLNFAGFVADLLAAGVTRKMIDRLTTRNTTVNAAPHKFTSSLVTV